MISSEKGFLTPYQGKYAEHVAFPIGGMGAGMFTLTGTGSLDNFSLRGKPDINNSPNIFAALYTKSSGSFRVLEGPVPKHKIFCATGGGGKSHGRGLKFKNYGLPRFRNCVFDARFPFATVNLSDETVPLTAKLVGWSPFAPNDSYNASLPFGCLEYEFTNTTDCEQEAVFYFQAENFIKEGSTTRFTSPKNHVADRSIQTYPIKNGFAFYQSPGEGKPWEEMWFHVYTDEEAYVDTKWFRGGWFDSITMCCNRMSAGKYQSGSHEDPAQGKGATLAIPFAIAPGMSRSIRLIITWYAPDTDVRELHEFEDNPLGVRGPTYKPWYTGQFDSITSLDNYILKNIHTLRSESLAFSDCFFASTLPAEILEAVSANLSIIKSPTVLRQTDGRLWGWEGCYDDKGSCPGNCTHVWNYAQSIANLFAELERGMRTTEFIDCQDEQGHQEFRASLPIGNVNHVQPAAADGQLGGIIKLYRDWRISGDTLWLKGLWPKAKQSLMYCIKQWDPDENGVLTECHHNTYDIEFWGADIMCSTFYIGALQAASKIAKEINDPAAGYFHALYEKGRAYCESELYNGEYFYQHVAKEGLHRNPAPDSDVPEVIANFEKDGPKYQYGTGCISDGVVGAWLCHLAGITDIISRDKLISHLRSVYKYNFKRDLSSHINPQRPGYALNDEAGLLLCTWPRGDKPELPFVYSDEVWTGIEYGVASYLIINGCLDEGLDIVRACRQRYTGEVRNPFNEYECGHWYARAMASYALLQAYSGAFYDNLTKTMHLAPKVPGDFACFISTATGYGHVGIKDGEPYVSVIRGSIDVERWQL